MPGLKVAAVEGLRPRNSLNSTRPHRAQILTSPRDLTGTQKLFCQRFYAFSVTLDTFFKIFHFRIWSRTAIKRGGSQKTLNESRLVWAINDVDEDDLRVCESTFYLQVNNTLINTN